jgi:glutamyl-Q tRNA(Asp) synthetase
MGFVTRFAPSPTGELHLGHAFAALVAEAWARLSGGRFLLRIDDLDHTRCRPEFEHAIHADLAWLGLAYAPEVRRQSDCMAEYAAALERLRALDVVYPCFCTRAEIQAELASIAGAPQGPEGPLYPGTCRKLPPIPSHTLGTSPARGEDDNGRPFAWRIDVTKAQSIFPPAIAAGEVPRRSPQGEDGGMGGAFSERAASLPPSRPTDGSPPERFALGGDIVLSRKETPASYHLAVVVDDAATGVTLVTRGEDLESATGLHMLLQRLLGLPTPVYAHHRLIMDDQGKRLAKRDKARSLKSLRASGATPEDIRRLVDWPAMEAEITNRLAASSF